MPCRCQPVRWTVTRRTGRSRRAGGHVRKNDRTNRAVAIVLMQGFGNFLSLLSLALTLFCAFAFFDSLFRREDAFRAADKKTKPFWAIVLGLALAVALIFGVGPMSFLSIIGLIAAIVYVVDVRPALKQVTGGGRRRGGSSSDGPYGPYNGGR
ncbi:predicted protein [Streptomyces sp. SPB78]|nr:predicted protein [Streptomyces sp. SPB78]